MAKSSPWLAIAVCAIAACGGYGPYRDAKLDDREVNAALAFLRDADASRTVVEARFGPAQAIFEQGRVVAYFAPVSVQQGPWNTPVQWRAKPLGPGEKGHQLMIEYDKDGRVVRHNVLQ